MIRALNILLFGLLLLVLGWWGVARAFEDVPSGRYYTDAVLWAEQNGIVNGTSDTTFEPDRHITRAEMVTILYRYDQAVDGIGDTNLPHPCQHLIDRLPSHLWPDVLGYTVDCSQAHPVRWEGPEYDTVLAYYTTNGLEGEVTVSYDLPESFREWVMAHEVGHHVNLTLYPESMGFIDVEVWADCFAQVVVNGSQCPDWDYVETWYNEVTP